MTPKSLYSKGGKTLHDWCLEIWGDYACFTRPEMKVERVSYDVITPSAARAIFESILWKPEIKWSVTKIEVLNPIKWVSVRRNEVAKTISPPKFKEITGESKISDGIYIEDYRQQRAGLFLKDVRYRIHGHFEVSNTISLRKDQSLPENAEEAPAEGKYAAMFERRAKKGQCYHRPYFGMREFACLFKLVDEKLDPSNPVDDSRDLGYMLYDMDFEREPNAPTPLFFRAKMEKGVISTDKNKVEIIG